MEENGNRLNNFRDWYVDPATEGQVRRCCVSLRLSMVATKIAAQKTRDDGPHAGIPTLVRLSRGEVQRRVVDELVTILPILHADPKLPEDTIPSALETVVHILVRFDSWLQYPAAPWKLSAIP